MGKVTRFREMEAGTKYATAIMVMNIEEKSKKSDGAPYVQISAFDGAGTEKLNFWDYTKSRFEELGVTQGTILQVTIVPTKKNSGSGNFYNIDNNDWSINTDPDITDSDFVHKAPIDPDECFQYILRLIHSVDSNPNNEGPYRSLAHLAETILKENEEAFKRSSAAVAMHHNFLAGLLYHTTRMITLAFSVCGTYKSLDKELLVCGTALHDIGKIICYDTKDVGEATVTVKGRLFDHALVGIMMIDDAAEKDVYNPEKIMMLEHMLASHHGKKEWDAITTPAFPEAEMLHLIDMIDSRMNMFEEAYPGQEAGTISDEKVFGLENSYIYKPLYPEA